MCMASARGKLFGRLVATVSFVCHALHFCQSLAPGHEKKTRQVVTTEVSRRKRLLVWRSHVASYFYLCSETAWPLKRTAVYAGPEVLGVFSHASYEDIYELHVTLEWWADPSLLLAWCAWVSSPSTTNHFFWVQNGSKVVDFPLLVRGEGVAPETNDKNPARFDELSSVCICWSHT